MVLPVLAPPQRLPLPLPPLPLLTAMKGRCRCPLRCSSIVLAHDDLQDIRGSRVEWRVEVTELERRRVRSQPQQQALPAVSASAATVPT